MIKLNWDKKKDISDTIESIKLNYKNKFREISSLLNNGDTYKNNQINKIAWTNKLFWGENLEVLYYLLNYFENKIDLIYIDPPFFSGTDYYIQIKEQNKIYEDIAYLDHWNKDLDSYLQMLYERLLLFKKLLSNKGLLFIHLDWHAIHYVKIILDEIFGSENFINSIVWHYYNKYSAGKNHLPKAHDNILVYSNSTNYNLNEIRISRKKPIKQLKRVMINGVLKNAKDENGKVVYRIVKDKKLDDVWNIPCMQPASKQWMGYPNQKHHKLLERIIKLGSNEGDLIADFFCGSGTTLLVAEQLRRKWIGIDISKYAIYLTRKRIMEYQKKFEVQLQFPFEIFANLNKEKNEIVSSNFFNGNYIIKRKK